MWRGAVILCVFGLLWHAPATAGAWPRGKGNGFVSVAYEYTTTRDGAQELVLDSGLIEPESFGFTSIYGEYGITDRVTLGLDIGEEDAPDTRQMIFFATLGLSPPDWRHQFAVEFGVGQREFPPDADDAANIKDLREGGTEQVLRPGVSWGYGFQTPWGGGWATLDLRHEIRRERDETVTKADLTIGLAPNDTSLIYLQTQYSDYPQAPQNIRLVPTYVYKFGPGFALESALLYDAEGGDRVGLRAGLWWEF